MTRQLIISMGLKSVGYDAIAHVLAPKKRSHQSPWSAVPCYVHRTLHTTAAPLLLSRIQLNPSPSLAFRWRPPFDFRNQAPRVSSRRKCRWPSAARHATRRSRPDNAVSNEWIWVRFEPDLPRASRARVVLCAPRRPMRQAFGPRLRDRV